MKKFLIWLLADALILIGVPVLYYNYLARQVDYEYATGIRTSSDGDIILIPVLGVFMSLSLLVLIVNVLAPCYYIWRHYRQVRSLR